MRRSTVVGLRDSALIAMMAYSFAVSAAVAMRVEDYFGQGKRRRAAHQRTIRSRSAATIRFASLVLIAPILRTRSTVFG
ncbi:MAG: hypothetical protein WAL59_24050 [Roseiarcus sp.]